MSAIDCIKDNYITAIINSCAEKGCKLELNDLEEHIVLKGEKILQDRKMCDCIIFLKHVVGFVELKSKTVHATEVVEKLTNGTKAAIDILEGCNNSTDFNFFHIVLAKKWNSSEYRVITKKKIKIRGKRYDIIPKKCGTSFCQIIPNEWCE